MTTLCSSRLGSAGGGLLLSTHLSSEGILSLQSSPLGLQPVTVSPEELRAEYQRGFAAGRQATQREVTSALQGLGRVAEAASGEARQVQARIDQYVISLALEIAARIAARELEKPEALRAMVQSALAQVPLSGGVTVRLHPQDLDALQRNPLPPLPKQLSLLSDGNVPRGGCLVETPAGRLDARFETQLAQIREALSGSGADA